VRLPVPKDAGSLRPGHQPTGYATHGQGGEEVNPAYRVAGGDSTTLWEIPEAGHTGGIDARPAEYERRMIEFFDAALLG
jgi:hypothetical protein